MVYLLFSLAICKYVFHGHLKFAHVILPEPILVPANGTEHGTLFTHYGQIENLVPLRVEVFVYGRRSFLGVSEGENEVLQLSAWC